MSHIYDTWTDLDKFQGFSCSQYRKHNRGKEFVIFDARISLVYKCQQKATTRLKLSGKVGEVSAVFLLHDINSIRFEIRCYCVGRYHMSVLSIYVMSDNST